MNRRGVWYALAAYGLWGVLPIYWKSLGQVDAFEILMHRMVWSLIFLIAVLAIRKRFDWLRSVLRDKKTLLLYTVASLLLGSNWGLFIWAVNADFIVETSLGYYITPLFNVLLGMVVFKERLRAGQWVAIGVAALGVVYLTINYGHLPWIALGLALSFSLYGVLKKKAPLGAFEGLTIETAVLFLPALGYLLYLQSSGVGAIGQVDPMTHWLLALTGVATAIPLLFFSAAAQRIPLTWIGFIQYLSPSISMVIALFLYHEPFGVVRQIGFIIIGVALLLFTMENVVYMRRSKRASRQHGQQG
ncbi:MAG: EamA family transporter RarD [Rhodothermaceae bacterium]|nr:EamA family transporter RarD [Rhodothermaceae bacterium]